MYYISKATLKPANKQYCSLKNDYEMTLHAHSTIVPCDNSDGIPTLHYDFVPIAELQNIDKDAIIGKRRSSISENLFVPFYPLINTRTKAEQREQGEP